PPLRRQNNTCAIFVISRRNDTGNHGMNKPSGMEPLSPFHITVVAIDKVPGMKHEVYARHCLVCFTDNTRPHRFYIVLGIPKINEGKFGLFGHLDLIPFTPGTAAPDTVDIPVSWFQAVDGAREVMGRYGGIFGAGYLQPLHGSRYFLYRLQEFWARGGLCPLDHTSGYRGIRTPIDCNRILGSLRKVHNDTIRFGRWKQYPGMALSSLTVGMPVVFVSMIMVIFVTR